MPKDKDTLGMCVYVPVELYRKFKSAIAGEGRSLKEVLISFMQSYVREDNGKGEGISEADTGKE